MRYNCPNHKADRFPNLGPPDTRTHFWLALSTYQFAKQLSNTQLYLLFLVFIFPSKLSWISGAKGLNEVVFTVFYYVSSFLPKQICLTCHQIRSLSLLTQFLGGVIWLGECWDCFSEYTDFLRETLVLLLSNVLFQLTNNLA